MLSNNNSIAQEMEEDISSHRKETNNTTSSQLKVTKVKKIKDEEMKETKEGKHIPIVKKLKNHLKKHFSLKKFQCDVCYRILKSSRSYKNHRLLHQSHVICQFCYKKLESEEELKNHSCSKKHKVCFCGTCGESFKNNYDLNRHQKTHIELEASSPCSVSSPTEEIIKDDSSKTEEVEIEVSYTIDECSSNLLQNNIISEEICEFYDNSSEIKCEPDVHTISDNINEETDTCLQIEKEEESSLSEKNEVNVSEKQGKEEDNSEVVDFEVCYICGEQCSLKKLKRHIKDHTEMKTYQCDYCGQILKSKWNLKRHLLIHEKHILCPSCHKKFNSVEELNNHVCNEKKENKRTFHVCETCGKCFRYAKDLVRHKRVHTKEKPFGCRFCDLAFAQKSNCANHEKRQHLTDRRPPSPSEKKFVCEICLKAFLYKHHLQRHLVVHTGEKPFVCKICYNCFKHSHHLKNHMLTHSTVRPFQCEECGMSFKAKRNLEAHETIHFY